MIYIVRRMQMAALPSRPPPASTLRRRPLARVDEGKQGP